MGLQESNAASRCLVLVKGFLDRVGSAGLVDGCKPGGVPMVGIIVDPLSYNGVLDFDGCFRAFAPVDSPAHCSAPIFYAVELAADDVNLNLYPVFLRSVSEALVVLTAPTYGA